MFDGGAVGGAFDENLTEVLDTLESKTVSVETAIGKYDRGKLKIISNRFNHIDPVARLESFRALKLSRLESFRVLKS